MVQIPVPPPSKPPGVTWDKWRRRGTLSFNTVPLNGYASNTSGWGTLVIVILVLCAYGVPVYLHFKDLSNVPKAPSVSQGCAPSAASTTDTSGE